MKRPQVLIIIALLLVLLFHPWTWGAHGPGNLGPTLIALAVIALVIYACAVRLGDLPSPLRRAPRRPPARRPAKPPKGFPPKRTANDVTRAAEELLRANRRRQP
jgi:hypothetical protein